jgi:hypothetical protein
MNRQQLIEETIKYIDECKQICADAGADWYSGRPLPDMIREALEIARTTPPAVAAAPCPRDRRGA